jgi:hypothetical protein
MQTFHRIKEMGLFERRDGHVDREQGRFVLPGWIEQHSTRGSGALAVGETGETGGNRARKRSGRGLFDEASGF